MTRIYCKLVGSAVLWGGTWVAGRLLGRYMGPFSAAFLRFALASVFLYFLTARIEGRFPRLRKQDLPWLLTLAATGIFAYNALFFRRPAHGSGRAGGLDRGFHPVGGGAFFRPALSGSLSAA